MGLGRVGVGSRVVGRVAGRVRGGVRVIPLARVDASRHGRQRRLPATALTCPSSSTSVRPGRSYTRRTRTDRSPSGNLLHLIPITSNPGPASLMHLLRVQSRAILGTTSNLGPTNGIILGSTLATTSDEAEGDECQQGEDTPDDGTGDDACFGAGGETRVGGVGRI